MSDDDEMVDASDTLSIEVRTVLRNSGGGDVFMTDLEDPVRLGGVALDENGDGEWLPLTETATEQRFGAAVAAVGRRVFVWGGYETTQDHADGAILTLP